MTGRQKRNVEMLERRRDHLAARVANYQGRSPSWDKAELVAISWAVRVIQRADHHGILRDLE